jgi:hypothetical protein
MHGLDYKERSSQSAGLDSRLNHFAFTLEVMEVITPDAILN